MFQFEQFHLSFIGRGRLIEIVNSADHVGRICRDSWVLVDLGLHCSQRQTRLPPASYITDAIRCLSEYWYVFRKLLPHFVHRSCLVVWKWFCNFGYCMECMMSFFFTIIVGLRRILTEKNQNVYINSRSFLFITKHCIRCRRL